MGERSRRSPFDLLTVLGAAMLFASLFLVWSHQLNRPELARFHGAALYGVVRDPTAFQVYAITGAVLGLLAIGIAAAGLRGRRRVRAAAGLGAALGLAFAIHAALVAPTNGVLLVAGNGPSARYFRDPATSGAGEKLAIVGLAVALAGLLPAVVIRRGLSAS